jgi:hypothetical protein
VKRATETSVARFSETVRDRKLPPGRLIADRIEVELIRSGGIMESKTTNAEILKLYLHGTTPRQIGELRGLSASTVAERLKRMGYPRPCRWLRSIPAVIDQSRLEILYTVERMKFGEIAAAFGVSAGVIARALAFYRIPKRLPLGSGGRYLGVLRRLRIGESAEIEFRGENQKAVLRHSADALGINIAVAAKNDRLIGITRISDDEDLRLAKIAGISRERLEELYAARQLSTAECACELGGDRELIRQALEFYGIPQRPAPNLGGKYASIFRALPVGETAELQCAAKRPYHNLHSIATRVGVKISMRKLGAGKFRITKLK